MRPGCLRLLVHLDEIVGALLSRATSKNLRRQPGPITDAAAAGFERLDDEHAATQQDRIGRDACSRVVIGRTKMIASSGLTTAKSKIAGVIRPP
jgi:hypothetical protein